MKTDLAFWLRLCTGVGGDQLFDGVEDELELLVVLGVFLFQGFDFLREQIVRVHQPAELDEGAHDGDIHLDCAR